MEQGIDGRRHPNSVRDLVQTGTGYKLLHMGRACGNIEPEFSKHYALLRTDASFHVATRENDAVGRDKIRLSADNIYINICSTINLSPSGEEARKCLVGDWML